MFGLATRAGTSSNEQQTLHRASERAISAGRKPESEAEETDRFETLEGALACLIEDFNVSGLTARPDEPRLFGDA